MPRFVHAACFLLYASKNCCEHGMTMQSSRIRVLLGRDLAVTRLLLTITLLVSFSAFASVQIEPSRLLIDERMEIEAGNYTYFELPLSAGTTLVAKFAVSGGLNNHLNVWLLDLPNYQLFRAGREYSYYKGTSGTFQRLVQYAFTIPATGLYYLVFDNRGALMLPRTAYANVYIVEPVPGAQHKKDFELYSGLYYGLLRKLFEFDDIDVTVRLCGTENAFSNPNITMCRELIDRNERHGIPAANIFVFFHEVAHSLLKLWGYPTWDNEEVADEMATVLSVLIKKEELALQAAQWWANSGSRQEALDKMVVDDRHTISPQRARNVVSWLNRRDELLRRWQKIWVPHMTHEALVALRDSTEVWVDKRLIVATLDTRNPRSVTTATAPSDTREVASQPSSPVTLLVGKWRSIGAVSPFVYEFRKDGTWTAQSDGSQVLGTASGKWNLAGDSFTGSVEKSTVRSLPKGHRWNDEVKKPSEINRGSMRNINGSNSRCGPDSVRRNPRPTYAITV